MIAVMYDMIRGAAKELLWSSMGCHHCVEEVKVDHDQNKLTQENKPGDSNNALRLAALIVENL